MVPVIIIFINGLPYFTQSFCLIYFKNIRYTVHNVGIGPIGNMIFYKVPVPVVPVPYAS
jgi:hypothetical protein